MKIIILGASGAVGGEVANTLLQIPDVTRITALVRRPLTTPHARITQHIVDVFDPASYAAHLQNHNVAICTFGVGEPSKVSREEFIRVDKNAVLDFAKACRRANVKHFELLGSVGADASSRSFYLRSKGELRDLIAAMGFERFSVFQPSMILTPQNRYGLLQGMMLATWPVLSPLLQGGLKKYRGIKVGELGAALALNTVRPGSGVEIFHWSDMAALQGLHMSKI